jgi:protein farnesyltransferase subunit beta
METETTDLQEETEAECKPFFLHLPDLPASQLEHLHEVGLVDGYDVCLLCDKHEEYLLTALSLKTPLNSSFISLDASRPWIMYWTLHSLDLLDRLPSNDVLIACVDTLRACWTGGGFGGGPGQMAHGAPTYAAVLSLAIISTSDSTAAPKAFHLLQEIRKPLYAWFLSLRHLNGGFSIHHDGEMDVRATYTVICCASLLSILSPQLEEGAVDFLWKCQTYEGGFGGAPGSEAHGGYTYCAVAALELLGATNRVDVPALQAWLARRQMTYEGGFNGRCNKLVDGCYSFWQGGAIAILSNNHSQLLLEEFMLQRYILLCAQDLKGGLRDKPSKPRDFYHSCYNLSGLSISQHYGTLKYGHDDKSRVAKTHACYNIRVERVDQVRTHFLTSNKEEE